MQLYHDQSRFSHPRYDHDPAESMLLEPGQRHHQSAKHVVTLDPSGSPYTASIQRNTKEDEVCGSAV
jgi:hypothetical protein